MNLRLRCTAFLAVLALSVATLLPTPASAQAFVARPKLIVIVVIDQFRGDYLNRDQAKFKGRGFNLFMKEGAWFTDCYYDYANTKTAPGHATLGTGAYSDGHGIETNEFWDASRGYDHRVSAVEDERYQLVDLPAVSIPANQPGAPEDAAKFVVGASPRNERATTFGDELRLATQGKSRVFGISLKDRAAILPAGHSANAAYWVDTTTGQFTTSTYYMEHLPEWVKAFNAGDRPKQAVRDAMLDETTQFYELVGRMPAANSYELDFAKTLIEKEKLGKGETTDLLIVSLSANDLQGHQFGPDSPFQEQMILSLDKDLDNFNTWLDRNIGLSNVWMALSADHGIAPIPAEAAKLGIPAAPLDMEKLYSKLNADLNARFSPGSKAKYFLSGADLPYITLDQRAFRAAGVDEKTAEETVAELLPADVAAQTPEIEDELPLQKRVDPAPQVDKVYTRQQFLAGQFPPSEMGRVLAHSVADHGNWFVFLILNPYQMASYGSGTTHFSPWMYDRHVPLAFFGAPFIPGEYHNRVAPVDLAATFASLAGVNQPSASVGRVLTEAIRPAGK